MGALSTLELELEFAIVEERGKPENPEKKPLEAEKIVNNKPEPTYDAGSGNETRATLVGYKRSHHCAIPASFSL